MYATKGRDLSGVTQTPRRIKNLIHQAPVNYINKKMVTTVSKLTGTPRKRKSTITVDLMHREKVIAQVSLTHRT